MFSSSAEGVEELPEGSWLFHSFMVLEHTVQCCDDSFEAFVFVITDRFSGRFNLLPNDTGEVGNDINRSFQVFLLNHHLLLI